jgi:hypothetical protein
MQTSTAELKSILLDILFLQDVNSLPDTRSLSVEDWSRMGKMIAQHRLGPMLHWRLTNECRDVAVPQNLREKWVQSYKASTFRSLTLQRELRKLHQIMQQSGLQYAALKGAWLAFHAYPQPGLRPMRDLDILVPQKDALRTYQVLLEAGCERLEKYPGSPESSIKVDRHLPPIRSVLGRTSIELHFRLYGLEGNCSPGFDFSAESGFWLCLSHEPLAGAVIPCLPAAEQLLHLIVHAVYDHRFNNGPLLISDLGYLIQGRSVNWVRFWELASQGGHERGALLALRLLERYWGKLGIEWPAGANFPEQELQTAIDDSIQLLLRDATTESVIRHGSTIKGKESLLQRGAYLVRKAFPTKTTIAALYPVSEDSIQVYAWYPAYLWSLCARRVPEFRKAKRQRHWKSEAAQHGRLSAWLKE